MAETGHENDDVSAAGRADGAFVVVGVERCPYCDYALEGLRERRCPECGEEISEDDIRLDARRRVYLELTRWSVVWGNLLLIGVIASLTVGLAVLPYALGLSAAFLVPGTSSRGLVGRVQRRVWLMSIGRLYSPWVVLVIVQGVVSVMLWSYFWIYEVDSLIEAVWAFLGPEATIAIGLAIYLGVVWLWRRRLRAVGRIAGLTDEQFASAFARRGRATRLAVAPVIVGGVALLVCLLAMRLLPWFSPDWGRQLF